MRNIGADKKKITFLKIRNIFSNMADSVGSFYVDKLNFRMIMPEKAVFQGRRKQLERFPSSNSMISFWIFIVFCFD
ncbi:hypothetical protein [Chryseobacterium wanjuense]